MLEMLKTLCEAGGVSGDEKEALDAVEKLLAPLGEIERTNLGSIICRLPKNGDDLPEVMLTAHIDRIGLIVTKITDKGFLKTAPCGGADRRSLSGARVTVHTKNEKLAGVIVATPPHLSDGKSNPPKAEELAVDIGFSAETAREKVQLGDRITFDGVCTPLLSDRVACAALDDRSGCAAVIRAAELLRDCKKANISVALVSQEETSSAGAATAANILAPDYAFVVDVSMAVTPDDRAEDCGELGKGPMIGVSPILSRSLSNKLIETAKHKNIPWQIEVMAGRTGTDADAIAVSGKGVRAATVSIPLRFMHTAGEIASLADIENTARLIAETVGGGL